MESEAEVEVEEVRLCVCLEKKRREEKNSESTHSSIRVCHACVVLCCVVLCSRSKGAGNLPLQPRRRRHRRSSGRRLGRQALECIRQGEMVEMVMALFFLSLSANEKGEGEESVRLC